MVPATVSVPVPASLVAADRCRQLIVPSVPVVPEATDYIPLTAETTTCCSNRNVTVQKSGQQLRFRIHVVNSCCDLLGVSTCDRHSCIELSVIVRAFVLSVMTTMS
jgi:hypothetical protein